jgi:hypothetical protein
MSVNIQLSLYNKDRVARRRYQEYFIFDLGNLTMG